MELYKDNPESNDLSNIWTVVCTQEMKLWDINWSVTAEGLVVFAFCKHILSLRISNSQRKVTKWKRLWHEAVWHHLWNTIHVDDSHSPHLAAVWMLRLINVLFFFSPLVERVKTDSVITSPSCCRHHPPQFLHLQLKKKKKSLELGF